MKPSLKLYQIPSIFESGSPFNRTFSPMSINYQSSKYLDSRHSYIHCSKTIVYQSGEYRENTQRHIENTSTIYQKMYQNESRQAKPSLEYAWLCFIGRRRKQGRLRSHESPSRPSAIHRPFLYLLRVGPPLYPLTGLADKTERTYQ